MTIRHTYRFQEMLSWDDELSEAIGAFCTDYGKYPNIFLCSSHTHGFIDFIAGAYPEHILSESATDIKEDEVITISSFSTEHCKLEFCVDENIPTGSFTLVYDSAPEIESKVELQL